MAADATVATAAPEVAADATVAAPAADAAVVTPAATALAAAAAPDTAASHAQVTITVQPGFTLWGIAKAQMGNGVMYVQVFDANRAKIKNPDLIYPGQVFTMPASP